MIEDLKAVIGKDVSENRSPTLRAKLIKVNKTTCTFEVVQSPLKLLITDKYTLKIISSVCKMTDLVELNVACKIF